MPLTPMQEQALHILATTPYNYLCGTAGTGKTYVARELAAAVEGRTVLASTTGIASVNLGEGTTIHSLLGYFDTASLKENYITGQLHTVIRRLRDRARLRRILIDEVSMMNGQQLTYITRATQEVNEGKTALEQMSEGDLSPEQIDELQEARAAALEGRQVGITLVGDFGQLPPVPDEDDQHRKLPVTFAFESPVWDATYGQNVVKLTEVLRQDAQDFVTALHAIRRADVAAALTFFTPQRFDQHVDDRFEGTTIVAKNAEVDRYNMIRLDELTGRWVRDVTVREGVQRGDWKKIPDVTTVKEGALIMMLANYRKELGGRLTYANGDLATFLGVDEDGRWKARIHRTNSVEEIVNVERENKVPLQPGRKKELIADGFIDNVIGKYEIIGRVTYKPVRVAYACTVHKTQGLTLDKVQVNLRDPFFKTSGMLFVALSRARTAEGLRIIGDQRSFIERCTINQRVRPWL